jgi:putative ABC transport system permease protein
MMRFRSLAVEALASARASNISTTLTATLVATMCVATLLTVGRTAAAELQVQQRIESAGSRLISVVDVKGLGYMSPSVVEQVSGLSQVERAIGSSAAFDVVNAGVGVGGKRVPAWRVTGSLASAVTLVAGRWPRAGESLISESVFTSIGMAHPVGAIASLDGATSSAVVGSFMPRSPFDEFSQGVVIASPSELSTHRLDVIANSAAIAKDVEGVTIAVLDRSDPTDLKIDSPSSLAELQEQVLGDIAATNRTLVLLVLAVGGALVAVVVLSDVLLRRKDLGRRRALGAARWVIITLVVFRSSYAAAIGAIVGMVAGTMLVVLGGLTPDWSFSIGTGVLALLCGALAAIPPAVFAAVQDPVRVLRTP